MNRSVVSAATMAAHGVSECGGLSGCKCSAPMHRTEDRALLASVMAFGFAPLVHRMIDKYGWTEEEAVLGFEDTKKFLYLCAAYPDKPMAPSERIDEVWHNFILFTEDYLAFCKEKFGFFIHHRPRRRDDLPSKNSPIAATLDAARETFGTELSENWVFKLANGKLIVPGDAVEATCGGSTNCQDSDCHDSKIKENVPQFEMVTAKCCGNCGSGCCKR